MSPWERFSTHYVMITYVSFMLHLILEAVLPGDSKAIGIVGTLLNLSYPELYSPEKKKKKTTTTMTTEKNWPGNVEKHEL